MYQPNFLPVKDNSKSPAVAWKQYQAERYTGPLGERRGVVCGAISGNLTALDFDDKGSAFEAWRDSVNAVTPLLLSHCYIESTPSGGYHVFYRSVEPALGNEKLAMKHNDDGPDTVLIETRGEGGFCVCAPTEGYKALSGSLDSLDVLNDEEIGFLKAQAQKLDQSTPKPEPAQKGPSYQGSNDWERDYKDSGELKADIENALIANGWIFREASSNPDFRGDLYAHPNCKDGGWHIRLSSDGGVYCYAPEGKSSPFYKSSTAGLEALSLLTGLTFTEIKKAYYQKHPEPKSDANFIRVMFSESSEGDNEEPLEAKDSRPALDADGIVSRLPEYFGEAYKRAVRSQVKTQKTFALFSLLSAVGVAGARGVGQKDGFGDTVALDTSLAGVIMGDSGSGKGSFKRVLQKALDNTKERLVVSADILSGQALAESLYSQKKVCAVFDEAQDTIFRADCKNEGDTLRKELKKAVSDSDCYALPVGIASKRRIAEIAENFGYTDTTRVYNPSTSAFFLGVSSAISNGITSSDINGGFAGRLFYCLDDKDSKTNFAPNAVSRLDFSESRFAELLFNLSSRSLEGSDGISLTVNSKGEFDRTKLIHSIEKLDLEKLLVGSYSEESLRYLTERIQWLEEEAPSVPRYNAITPVLARQRELLVKLAFIFSLIESYGKEELVISLNASELAWECLEYSLDVLAYIRLERQTVDGETAESRGKTELYLEVLEYIKKQYKTTKKRGSELHISRTWLKRNLGRKRFSNEERLSWVLKCLSEGGFIEIIEGVKRGEGYLVKPEIINA